MNFKKALAYAPLALCLTAPGAHAQTVVKVAVARAMASASTFLAVDKGYFKEAGITIEFENANSSANVLAPLATNQIQFVEGGVSAGYFNAIEQGLPITIISDRVSTPLNHKLLVRADLKDKIKRISDLKGKNVASNGPAAVTTYEIGKILEADGIGLKDIDIKVLGFPQMGAAFKNGAIDAGLVIQPWAYSYDKDGFAFIFAGPDDYAKPSPMTIAVTFVNTDWAAKNKAVLNEFMVAYLRGVREYCQAYHGGASRKDVIDVSLKFEIDKSAENIERYPWPARNMDGSVNMDSVRDMQDYFRKEGLTKNVYPDARVYDPQYLNYANAKLGPAPAVNPKSDLKGCR